MKPNTSMSSSHDELLVSLLDQVLESSRGGSSEALDAAKAHPLADHDSRRPRVHRKIVVITSYSANSAGAEWEWSTTPGKKASIASSR